MTKDISEMSLEELSDHVTTLSAQVDEEKKNNKEALKSMDEKNEKEKEAMDEEHKKEMKDAQEHKDDEHKEKMSKLQAAILKAMEEEDKDKREAMIKSAMEEHTKEEKMSMEEEQKKNHTGMNDEEKEENKAMKAQITYLSAQVNKPRLEYLEAVYKAAKTPEDDLKEFKSDWEKMDTKQLDGAIKKTKPLVDSMPEFSVGKTETQSPFGFTGADIPKEFSANINDKQLKKIDDMSDAELFEGGPYY